jgi:hypothetical protein
MNKLVLSALAASVAVGTTNASEGDWAGLDAELNTLTSSLDNHGGPAISGYLEATYDTDTGAGDSAFRSGRHGVNMSGSVGGYGYNFDLTGANTTQGADAFITFEMGGIGWTMGDFRAPTTANHLINEEDMHFMDRSDLGGDGARTTGLMASGSMDALGYWIHIGDAEELTARVSYDVMSGDGINLSVAYSMDDEADNSWIEANISSGQFSVSATMGDADDRFNNGTLIDGKDDAMVVSAAYSVNDTWNLGIRSSEIGGPGGGESMDWAVTYADGGARWTFQTNEDDELMLGCIVGF